MTAIQETAVKWPAWEDAAFYNQEPEVIYASIAAQRHAAPVYWYEPPGYPTGFWVLSKYEHQRFVASHPDLFSSRYGFAIGDASDPSTVMHQLPEWAKEKILSGDLDPAEIRRTIAHGKLSMGDPEFESLMISDPSSPWADPQHHDEVVAAQPGPRPEAAHRRDHRGVPHPD